VRLLPKKGRSQYSVLHKPRSFARPSTLRISMIVPRAMAEVCVYCYDKQCWVITHDVIANSSKAAERSLGEAMGEQVDEFP
jgi:hypothetical protein